MPSQSGYSYLGNHLSWHHRDPAGRFIIASAQSLKATVVTTDRNFKLYNIKVIR
ncbi:MAG: hypothetical protein JJT75_01060 [Opitutales bacterium]|nr:hypothetical protein [Opitutales bacterium]MCH8541221.1 hypothetical protein [Opitutales bacterium]